ncbi:MAG TPA: hypothetical protein VGM50_00160 [Gemmatimonadaceae bacterium]
MRDLGDEDGPQQDAQGEPDLEAVRQRLAEIQETKRGRVRWTVSRKTAEMALVALEDFGPPSKGSGSGSGKARRRKRFKRLL